MTGMYEYKTGCNFSRGPLTQEKWQKSYTVLLREAEIKKLCMPIMQSFMSIL